MSCMVFEEKILYWICSICDRKSIDNKFPENWTREEYKKVFANGRKGRYIADYCLTCSLLKD